MKLFEKHINSSQTPSSIIVIYKYQELQNEQKELQSVGWLMLTDLSSPFNIKNKKEFSNVQEVYSIPSQL